RDAAAAQGLRLQLLVPEHGRSRRVTLYRRPTGAFTRFDGRELQVPVPAQVRAGVPAHRRAVGAAVGERLGRAADELLAGGGVETGRPDFLVCTHGRRDRCCGSLGTELWEELGASGFDGDGARLARTSHTGGHRFAATCVVLPAGTVWGLLDADALRRIAMRRGPIDDLLPRYRGCSGLGSPAAQVLERSVLAEVGWPLFDCARSVEEVGGGRLRLSASGPAGTHAWEATVVPDRTVSVPDCGQPIELSKKTETQYRVEGFTAVG
ncbi:MAG: sucrase ferredoxin, partial [Acidimicrobiales bacterium]